MERSYIVEIDGTEYPVVVSEGADGRQVRVGEGPEQAADWSMAQAPALYSLLLDAESRQVRVVPDAEEQGGWAIELGPYHFAARVQTEREQRLGRVAASKAHQTGEITVKAPMPGLVRAVSVAVGDAVQQGQRLLLLEAMKMENDIQAPRAGTVKAVKVAAGETVERGRPLVVLE
ncbi:MAG: biotin/lipoyl-containing protein [Chloroflexia bacterium]